MDIQRLKEILDRPGATSIVVGENYGLDEMASALALNLAFSAQGKQVGVISKKQPQVEVSNLVGIDQVKSKFESASGDLVVSFPFRDDEIGKVSYTLENGLLNIIVKPKGENLSFSEKDVMFARSGDMPGILITVGVKRLSELQGLFNVESLKDTTIINIDKGQNNENFGEVVIISQGASSVSEQVASLLVSLGYPMDPDIAQNLFSGIMQSTGNFQSPKTSSLAFEMAGVLLRNGARRETPRSAQPLPSQNARIFGSNRPTRPFTGGPAPRQVQQFDQRPKTTQPQPRFDQSRPAPRQQERNTTEYSRELKQDDQDQEGTPPDWLAPKIYKGSTNVE
jgi:hypothetical protein